MTTALGFRPIVSRAELSPAVGIDVLAGDGDVLVLAPHPDDETLGCGAAIAAAVEAGRRVHVVVVTDGAASHPDSRSHPPARLAALRAGEVATAVRRLTGGASEPILLGYPDQGAPDRPEAHAEIADRLAPQMRGLGAIWSAWEGDPHPDHQRTWTLARFLSALSPSARLLAYPVWGRVQGEAEAPLDRPLLRFAAAPWRAIKANALDAHRSQTTRMISDDPAGFMLEPCLARHFVEHDEIFIDLTP